MTATRTTPIDNAAPARGRLDALRAAQLAEATLADLEKKRHKKNPFDDKYLQFLLQGLAKVSGCMAAHVLWPTCS